EGERAVAGDGGNDLRQGGCPSFVLLRKQEARRRLVAVSGLARVITTGSAVWKGRSARAGVTTLAGHATVPFFRLPHISSEPYHTPHPRGGPVHGEHGFDRDRDVA